MQEEQQVVVLKEEKKEKTLDITEHRMSLEKVCELYQVQVNQAKPTASPGLKDSEIQGRIEKYGLNQLSPPKKKHPIVIYFEHLCGLFNLMLIFAGVVAFILYSINTSETINLWVGVILVAVSAANAFIEFYQGQKSQAILESFLNLIPSNCYVIREGALCQVSALNLVVGDVVYIKSGDKIPADLCMFWTNELKVDNSSLTGEADPQERTSSNTHENPLEATNLVFNGTLVVNGEGYGIAIRTGDNTVIGQIASLTGNEERRESPMAAEIEHFVKTVAFVAGVFAIVFLLVAIFAKKLSAGVALNFAIGIFVAFVPQGLPATVTMLLTIAAKRMATRNVLVKDLQGVETLGAITLLATDKTGTLTRNQMTVTYLWSGFSLFYASTQSSSEAQHAEPLDTDHDGVREILYSSILCSRARFESNTGPINSRPVLGDATETGLLKNAASKLANFDTLMEEFPKVLEVPFNSDNKWAMTIHKKKHANGHFMLYLKGAPERVLRLCSKIFDGKKQVELSEEHKNKFNETYRFMASKGHRVLAFACLPMPGDQYPEDMVFTKDPVNYPTRDLTFYGLVSLEDPPKHGVREAIGHCREAGIKVMMVTGDHPLTAEAIGRKINLMLQDTREKIAEKRKIPQDQVPESDVNAIVIHGEQVDSLTDAQWDNIFSKEEIIFARTSPKHKLTIVKRAQALGHIVGVTGDGVNDSPALKKADLGIAMNQSGSDVSKEAAAMILIDDNFASTVNGIEEGRLIFQNLKKSIQYTISHIAPEVWAYILYVVVPIPVPLSTVLILVVDLGFDLAISLSYAWDPPETKGGLVKLQPRKPVTESSIKRLRAIEAENKELAIAAGKNPDEPYKPTFVDKVKKVFTKKYWTTKKEPTEEEILVDKELLSYAFLEAGTIMTIGCLTSFFVTMYYQYGVTPYDAYSNAEKWGTQNFVLSNGNTLTTETQVEALAVGQSIYYLGIMIQQSFNLFINKARMGYPFGAFIFGNIMTFVCLFGGAAFSMLIVYVPPINIAFQTSWRLSPLMWLVPFAFGMVLLGYSVLRMTILRIYNPLKFTKDIAGLDLHPTRWSTGR